MWKFVPGGACFSFFQHAFIAIHVGSGSCEICHQCLHVSWYFHYVGLAQVVTLLIGPAFLSFIEDTTSQRTSWSCNSYNLPFLLWFSLLMRCRNFAVDVTVETGLHSTFSELWSVMDLYFSLHLFQKEAPWWGVRAPLTCKDKYLECW